MPESTRRNLVVLRNAFQFVLLYLLIAATVVAVGFSLLAALGIVPWLELGLGANGVALPMAGMIFQLGVTVLLMTLCFLIPTNTRVMRLERSHRTFQMSMEDVAAAYAAVHAADREGAFNLSGEFEAMRERMAHLRAHPDLKSLEPELLEVAAQMSHESRDLASVYSDDAVARAKAFLKQREEELLTFEQQLTMAEHATNELRRWTTDIEQADERIEERLSVLSKDLKNLLPNIGYDLRRASKSNVVKMQADAKDPA